LGPGEVRIDVRALGLNRAEVLFRQGLYLTQPSLPSRLGYECAGVVSAVGEGVDGFAVGERVGTVPLVDMSTQGVWAEQVVVPATAVVRSPDSLTDAQAAAIWIAYGTAWGGLVEAGGLSAGDVAVIPAASSSTGIAALQIARHLGATSVAVTRTDAKKDDPPRARRGSRRSSPTTRTS
jgi:NADPH2:quinone reductase